MTITCFVSGRQLRENCGASEKEKKKEQLSSVKCLSSVKEKVRSHLEEIVKAFAYCDIDGRNLFCISRETAKEE
jgi:hypothetical protein